MTPPLLLMIVHYPPPKRLPKESISSLFNVECSNPFLGLNLPPWLIPHNPLQCRLPTLNKMLPLVLLRCYVQRFRGLATLNFFEGWMFPSLFWKQQQASSPLASPPPLSNQRVSYIDVVVMMGRSYASASDCQAVSHYRDIPWSHIVATSSQLYYLLKATFLLDSCEHQYLGLPLRGENGRLLPLLFAWGLVRVWFYEDGGTSFDF